MVPSPVLTPSHYGSQAEASESKNGSSAQPRKSPLKQIQPSYLRTYVFGLGPGLVVLVNGRLGIIGRMR